MVELQSDIKDEVRKRLRRVGGQVRGIERMIDQGRECREIVTQIAAAAKALEQTGFRIVAAGVTDCLQHPDHADGEGQDPIALFQELFMKLA